MNTGIRLYKTARGGYAERGGHFYAVPGNWQQIINRHGLYKYLDMLLNEMPTVEKPEQWQPLAPIDSQEVWAAGVTYLRSKAARMDESKQSGANVFYDKVYEAGRPELFFKATPLRVSGPDEFVRIRKDSTWNVPEPELTLFISSEKTIEGYTIGNDMSSRSIEGENPLYLPQAKSYDGCAAMGPCLLVLPEEITMNTGIHMAIERNGSEIFKGSASLAQMKRSLTELADWLMRECSFPNGAFLMTGTCLVPGNEFTLQPGDKILIEIDSIGRLINTVAAK
jgi:2-dehydro-3-deoxy-D-arabinonate dehydratase